MTVLFQCKLWLCRLFSFYTVQISRVNRNARSRDRERGLSKFTVEWNGTYTCFYFAIRSAPFLFRLWQRYGPARAHSGAPLFLRFLSGFNEQTCARVRKQKSKALKINMSIHTHTCSPIFHTHKMASFSVGFIRIRIGKPDVLHGIKREEEVEEEREREREREIVLVKSSSPRRENGRKGGNSRERPPRTPKLAKKQKTKKKQKGQNFFFLRLAVKINARGERETEKFIIVP